MLNVSKETEYVEPDSVEIVLFNDDETPLDFVVDLLRSVFGKSEEEAVAFAAKVDRTGRSSCGPYPADVAEKLLALACARIKKRGLSLALTAEPLGGLAAKNRCAFCGEPVRPEMMSLRGKNALICDDCILIGARNLSQASRTRQFKYAHEALACHFAGIQQDQLVTTTRQFPGHMRADVQVAIDKLFSASATRFFGILEQYRYETLTFAALTRDGQHAHPIAPAQYRDVDIGNEKPVKCLNNGLWLCNADDLRYAVVLSFHREYGHESGTCVEIAVPVGEGGSVLYQPSY
jgi:ATP-dependent Clp protease adapter protein ClpS